MKTFIDKMDYAVKNWWLSLLVGLLYIIVAIYLMFAPLASYVALSILFSVSMFVSGLFEIAFALANKKGISSWGWYLAGGIIDLIWQARDLAWRCFRLSWPSGLCSEASRLPVTRWT